METYNQKRYEEAGLGANFVQDNVSFSQKGVLRGLHVQNPNSQGKLVQVLQGSVFDVAVDIRVDSPHFGKHVSIDISAENKRQFYIPPGFAHGFLVTSETAMFSYKCTELYAPKDELSILWNDPDIGIDWPNSAPTVSQKDQVGQKLRNLDQTLLPKFGGSQ